MSFIPSADVKAKDKKDNKQNQTAQVATPVTQDPEYCAELDGRKMDFAYLQDKSFIVAVSTGDRNKPKLLASTIRGPFNFYEMVEAVGTMYEREQHHAKTFILEKAFDEATSFLDEGTIDYIEANWQDIVFTGVFEQELLEESIPAGSIDMVYGEENKKD